MADTLPPNFHFAPGEVSPPDAGDDALPPASSPVVAPSSNPTGGSNGFVEKTWRVDYTGSAFSSQYWSTIAKRLWFDQNSLNTPSVATHVFHTSFTLKDQPLKAFLLAEIQKLSVDKEIVFAIVPLAGEKGKAVTHHHVLYDWSHRVWAGGATIMIKTAERSILATREIKNRAHKTEPDISAVVKKLMQEYKIDVKAQPCQAVEWVPETKKTLIQRNLTDMEFLVNELVPRSATTSGKGGYIFFTTDGKTGFYQPFGTPAGNYAPLPEAVLEVEEMDRSFNAARSGGSSIKVEGFDMHAKKVITKTFPDSGHTPAGGDTKARVTGLRYEYLPVQKPDAVEAWAKQRFYSNSVDACPVRVKLRGQSDFNIGDTMDLSKSSYRDHGNYKGTVAQIRHSWNGSRYTQLVLLLTDAQTSASGQVQPMAPNRAPSNTEAVVDSPAGPAIPEPPLPQSDPGGDVNGLPLDIPPPDGANEPPPLF